MSQVHGGPTQRKPGHYVTPSVHPSLDLDAWINEPPSDSESEDEKPKAIFHEEEPRHTRRRQPEEDEEELARVSRPFQEYPAYGRSSAWDLFTKSS